MKNTNLFKFQNGLIIPLAARLVVLGRANEVTASENMEKGEDGLYYYKERSQYVVYNGENYLGHEGINLVYYTDMEWRYVSEYNRKFIYKNSVVITLDSYADAVDCLRTGNYDKAVSVYVPSIGTEFQYYNGYAPWNRENDSYADSETYNTSDTKYYVYLSTQTYSYGYNNHTKRYVDIHLLKEE
jgi:hypothetical protein